MTRDNLAKWIEENYSVFPEYLWHNAPSFAVFRHSGNKKWFAVIMNIEKNKLGNSSKAHTDIVNLKCDPVILGSLLMDDGIYPAYHMNKSHWISVVLDEISSEKLEFLLEMSFKLTQNKSNR